MAENKFTPGPWKLNGTNSKVENNDGTIDICETSINCEDDEFGYEQYKANGLLISAAPDLLEALEELMEYQYVNFGPAGKDYHREFFETMAKALKAIAKAKGETN